MSKRKAKPASPPTEWSLPQVMAAAQILYASEEKIRNLLGLGERRDEQSIKLKWDEAWRWRLLARLAYQFLDNLSHACEAIARDERNPASAWARFEEQGAAFFAEAAQLPDPVPFDQAQKFITRRKDIAGARKKFEILTRAIPDYFRPEEKLAQWQKEGIIPRADVLVGNFAIVYSPPFAFERYVEIDIALIFHCLSIRA